MHESYRDDVKMLADMDVYSVLNSVKKVKFKNDLLSMYFYVGRKNHFEMYATQNFYI